MAGADKTSGRTQSGRDQEGIRRRLDTLGERLAEVQARHAPPPPPDSRARGEALGYALRLGVELVAGVAVGGFIGWALDRWLGSAPFLMVVFLVLGAAAGIDERVSGGQGHAGQGAARRQGLAARCDG